MNLIFFKAKNFIKQMQRVKIQNMLTNTNSTNDNDKRKNKNCFFNFKRKNVWQAKIQIKNIQNVLNTSNDLQSKRMKDPYKSFGLQNCGLKKRSYLQLNYQTEIEHKIIENSKFFDPNFESNQRKVLNYITNLSRAQLNTIVFNANNLDKKICIPKFKKYKKYRQIIFCGKNQTMYL